MTSTFVDFGRHAIDSTGGGGSPFGRAHFEGGHGKVTPGQLVAPQLDVDDRWIGCRRDAPRPGEVAAQQRRQAPGPFSMHVKRDAFGEVGGAISANAGDPRNQLEVINAHAALVKFQATAALHRLSDTGDVRALLEWLSVRS